MIRSLLLLSTCLCATAAFADEVTYNLKLTSIEGGAGGSGTVTINPLRGTAVPSVPLQISTGNDDLHA